MVGSNPERRVLSRTTYISDEIRCAIRAPLQTATAYRTCAYTSELPRPPSAPLVLWLSPPAPWGCEVSGRASDPSDEPFLRSELDISVLRSPRRRNFLT